MWCKNINTAAEVLKNIESVVSQMVIKCNNNAISSSIDEYTGHHLIKAQALRRISEYFILNSEKSIWTLTKLILRVHLKRFEKQPVL